MQPRPLPAPVGRNLREATPASISSVEVEFTSQRQLCFARLQLVALAEARLQPLVGAQAAQPPAHLTEPRRTPKERLPSKALGPQGSASVWGRGHDADAGAERLGLLHVVGGEDHLSDNRPLSSGAPE